MRVEDLSQFGKPLGMPKKAQRKMLGIDRQGTWKSDSIVDEEDRQRIRVVSCANVELFSAIGCPELGKLGCEHDLAGYPVILDRVDAEFRRPCALAKGDDFCDFNFYRKATAPPTEHLNK